MIILGETSYKSLFEFAKSPEIISYFANSQRLNSKEISPYIIASTVTCVKFLAFLRMAILHRFYCYSMDLRTLYVKKKKKAATQK